VVSVYEESAAAVALSRLDAGGLTDAEVVRLLGDLRSRRDPRSGWVADSPAVSGAPATWAALRALDALGRHEALDQVWQHRLIRTVVSVIDDPAKAGTSFERRDNFRIARFLVEHGDREVSATAARALAGSPAGRGCQWVFAGDDVDIWAANAESADAAGATCPLPPDRKARLRRELETVQEGVRAGGGFTIGAIERLRSIQTLDQLQGHRPGPLADALGRAVAALQTDLAVGRVETRAVPLADASEILAVAGRRATIAPATEQPLRQVLTWGDQFTTFQPSVPLFGFIARSLLLLEPGRDTAERLSGLVDWQAVHGLDRLALAAALRPGLVTAADIGEAARQAGVTPAGARREDLWRDAAVAATIANAALMGHVRCAGELGTWTQREVRRLGDQHEAVLRGSPAQLTLVATLLRFAQTCPDRDAAVPALTDRLRRHGAGELDATLRQAQSAATPESLRGLRLGLEVACLTATPVSAGTRAGVSDMLARIASGGSGIGVVDSSGRFLPEETFALLRSRQLLARCP
jgi:hypothetical protein